MPNHPLAEIFGFRFDDQSKVATRHRKEKLCPYHNRVANCTKVSKTNPLGVCSLLGGDTPAIICPIRFREDWLITRDAAEFFFPPEANWTYLREVRLPDAAGKSAGNIDLVLVSHDENGKIVDFGAVEVQSVYISGNLRDPFRHYMKNPREGQQMDWRGQPKYPRPDYLSSSRKRLAPQLLFKGGIIRGWKKKQAVVLHRGFWETLPNLAPVEREIGEVAWLIYDLQFDEQSNRYKLVRHQVVYTLFETALTTITIASPGPVDAFVKNLEGKLAAKLHTA
jgi:hypothetical protein